MQGQIIVFSISWVDCVDTIESIDLLYKNGYFFVNSNIHSEGKQLLLLDTNFPCMAVMSKSINEYGTEEPSTEVGKEFVIFLIK